MIKKFLLGVAIATVFAVGATVPAVALTTDELQTRVKELLAKVAELTRLLEQKRQGNTTNSVGTGTAGSPPVYTHRVCLAQMRTLSEGQRGDEVLALQEFLQSEKLFFVTPTGFFGPLTREALKKWQAQEGIDPAGVAGPRTAERLRIRCGGGPGIPGQQFSATPMRGEAPLTVVFDTWLSGFRIRDTSYTIDFGDGSSEQAVDCPAPADACVSPGQNTHTYASNGMYTATLNKITDLCGNVQNPMVDCAAPVQTEVIGRLQIYVGSVGTACTKEYAPVCGARPVICIKAPCNPIPTTYANHCMMRADKATFLYEGQCRTSANKPPVISNLSGPTTLRVDATGTWTIEATDPENGSLSYSVDWGEVNPPSGSPSGQDTRTPYVQITSFTHSYATAGTYTVSITVADSAGQTTTTKTTVKVGNAQIACTAQYDPVCGRPPGCANTCTGDEACPAICQLPDPKTYGNRCQNDAAGAEFLHTGRCTSASQSR